MTKLADRQSHVTLETYADGKVRIHIAGDNGQSLTLIVDVTHNEPFAELPKSWTGQGLYRAVVGVQANGHLRGWLVDQQNDQIIWFPKRAKRKQPKR